MLHRASWIALAVTAWISPAPLAAQPIDSEPLGDGSEIQLEPFEAVYDVKTNGLTVGTLTVTLERREGRDWLLKQESASRGLGSLFAASPRIESSRLRLSNGEIQVLEYRSRKKGGDAEENARLVFDWEKGYVKSLGAGPHWEIPVTRGIVDPLVMQLVMRLDLQTGRDPLAYRVPRQGRIKTYTFERTAEESLELDAGRLQTLKVERTDDDRDRTSIWSAPDLRFFAVRILKERDWDVDTDVVLRSVDFPARAEPRSSDPTAR
jgi:hypothetical protein